MSERIQLYGLIILVLVASCSPQPNYITEVEIESFWPDTITSLTVEENSRRSRLMIKDIMFKTIGKEIPPLEVYNLSGDILNLKDVLNGEMIIISCDAHCSWSSEHAMNDFPKAIKKLEEHSIYPEIICLLLKSEYDVEKPAKFDQLLEELKACYNAIYIIEDSNAMKLNLIGGSGRMIVNEEQIVLSLGFGVSITDDDRIFNELYPFLSKTN